ncbi:DNA-directed RNA polymerase subunit, partial [Haematococcus lacustris]
MTAIPAKEVTTRQVAAVGFSFYSDEEVRKLSVKRIIQPVIFDNLRNPVPGGLYDPALGPLDNNGRCATCGLGGTACPGHFGHVELPVPAYNPMIF